MKHTLTVQIMGHEYPVETNSADDLYVNRLAQFVEEKMKAIIQTYNSRLIDNNMVVRKP